MHMANELLTLPVAAGTWTLAGIGLAAVCRKLAQSMTTERLSLMGVLGAFVFAAQMVNIPLPGLPGTSGHMIGAVLLAILLGPHAAALAVASVVMVQCLLFQDGGLLAMGCNLINMALVPAYLGYGIYCVLTDRFPSRYGTWVATVSACMITVWVGATLVVLEVGLAGVVTIPLGLFLWTMWGVHAVIGLLEGLLTVAVIAYLQQVKPELMQIRPTLTGTRHTRSLLVTFAILTVLVSGILSLWASDRPDGLEWSYAERPDQPSFTSVVHNETPTVRTADAIQDRFTPLPDYSRRRSPDTAQAAAGWTSFAGLVGSLVTMLTIWLGARALRWRRRVA
jgi:cobalt/nickel transport system permease protein